MDQKRVQVSQDSQLQRGIFCNLVLELLQSEIHHRNKELKEIERAGKADRNEILQQS